MLRRLSESELRVRPVEAADEAAPRCELVLDGRPTGHRVEGAVLEAAVSCGDGRLLLFLTDDVPQEDALTVLLLGPDLALLDAATLGAMYATGRFEALQLREPDRIGFRFIGEADWEIGLLRSPQLALPGGLGDPAGVKRPWALRRHFVVRGEPKPG